MSPVLTPCLLPVNDTWIHVYCVALEPAAVTGQPGQHQKEHPRHSEGFGVFSGEMGQEGVPWLK